MVCYVYLKMTSIEINQILAWRHGLGINFVSDTDQRGTSINCLCIAIAAPLTAVSGRGWKLILMRVVDSSTAGQRLTRMPNSNPNKGNF